MIWVSEQDSREEYPKEDIKKNLLWVTKKTKSVLVGRMYIASAFKMKKEKLDVQSTKILFLHYKFYRPNYLEKKQHIIWFLTALHLVVISFFLQFNFITSFNVQSGIVSYLLVLLVYIEFLTARFLFIFLYLEITTTAASNFNYFQPVILFLLLIF